jgi:hypothetical protein
MSSAFYPQGMNSYNNRLPQGGYESWKGSGIDSNPIAITAGTIRPFTNKDYTNSFPTGFGLPRPLKIPRKGRAMDYQIKVLDPNNAGQYTTITVNRYVKSSTLGSLVKQTIDNPGSYSVTQNTLPETEGNIQALDNQCSTCHGIGLIASYYPNNTYLTENPETNTTNPPLCCNEENKALQRVIYASTNLKKNYYTTHFQYLQNRCKTYKQRAFNFVSPNIGINSNVIKPGSPQANNNTYYANCYCNSEIQGATEIALSNKFMSILLNKGIITQAQLLAYQQSNSTTLSLTYQYIVTLPEPFKTEAIQQFNLFVNNPYYGIPFSGPAVSQKTCGLVVYKPNNYNYGKQGAVDSSTRTLKQNVDTITLNAASFKNKNNNFNVPYAYDTNLPFILKNKAPVCNQSVIHKDGNPKTCGSLSPVSTNKFGYNASRNGYKLYYL